MQSDNWLRTINHQDQELVDKNFNQKQYITDIYNCEKQKYILEEYIDFLKKEYDHAGYITPFNKPEFLNSEYGIAYKNSLKKIQKLPIKPSYYKQTESIKEIFDGIIGYGFMGIVVFVILFIGLFLLFGEHIMLYLIICTIALLCCIFYSPVKNIIKYFTSKNDFAIATKKYNEKKAIIEKENQENTLYNNNQYRLFKNKYDKFYKEKEENYKTYLQEKQEEIHKKRLFLSEEQNIAVTQLKNLTNTINFLYNLRLNGVLCLHPSYQGLNTISILYGYFDTGRCYTLEGHEGAYNLYEEEKFKGIIVDKLNRIEQKLNMLNSTMYYIGVTIKECKDILEELSYNVSCSLNIINDSLDSFKHTITKISEHTENTAIDSKNSAYYSEISAKMSALNTYYQMFKDL